MANLDEPAPYDNVPNINSDNVPDLLVFSRPLLNMGMNENGRMGTIASDSCMAVSTQSVANELGNDVLNTMAQALYNLSTSTDKEQTRKHIRDSIIDVTDGEGNK